MKIPNFASWYHCGAWNFASDAQDGANGPRAATASTRRTVSATPGSCAGEEVASAARSRAGRVGRRPWIIGGPPADSTAGAQFTATRADLLVRLPPSSVSWTVTV